MYAARGRRSLDIVRAVHAELPILGVCLGHQVIAEALGGRIVRAASRCTAETSAVIARRRRLVRRPAVAARRRPLPFAGGRTGSRCPRQLRATAWTDDGVLMAFEHGSRPVFGVQFHPESILTEGGYELLANFLQRIGLDVAVAPAELAADELRG